jgi:hypothetical protein
MSRPSGRPLPRSAFCVKRRCTTFKRDENGATAIEFAAVAMPFLMFVFGLIGMALYFFLMNSVEKGMDQTSRLIRTGQAKESGMTVDQFKQAICDKGGGWIKCDKLQVFVNRFSGWDDVNPSPCVDSSKNVITNSSPGGAKISESAGNASEIVIVTSCYKWDLTASIPFIPLGNLNDGSMMMQSATAFRVEPHDK